MLHIIHCTQLCQCPLLFCSPAASRSPKPGLPTPALQCPQLPCSLLPPPCHLSTSFLFVGAAHVADACSSLSKWAFSSRTLQENLLIPTRCNLSHISYPKSKVLKESSNHFLLVNVNENHSISGFALLEHFFFFFPPPDLPVWIIWGAEPSEIL